MAKAITVPLKSEPAIKQDPLLERALETLDLVQTYVDTLSFSARGLMRGLGKRDRTALDEELARLIKDGYVERVSGSDELMHLTMRGKTHAPASADDDE